MFNLKEKEYSMRKRIAFFLACIVMSSLAFAQTKVTGTVISVEDGEPIPGASVLIEGTKTGVVTDANGKFALTVPADAKRLEISCAGMLKQLVRVKPVINIELATDDKSLDEVMVVAFGTATKQTYTGSATVVDAKDIAKHTTTNVANALVGNVPGLQMRGSSGEPGASEGAMHIRGINSVPGFGTGTDPLIIVDGAPYSGSLSNINPQDVEQMTVLKDAASAALYGARGANGVILITTKRGKSKDAEVTVDMKWGGNSRAVRQYDLITNPGQHYETYYSALYNQEFYGNGKSAADANATANARMLTDLGYNIYSLPAGELLIGQDGKLNPNATMGNVYSYNGTDYYLQPDNWTKNAYSTAFRQEYNVSIKGQTEKSNIFASIGYMNDDGIIEKSSYQRLTARLKADYQAKKWLRFGANVAYTNSETHSTPLMESGSGAELGSTNLMYFTDHIAPIYPIWVRTLDANGNPVIATDQYGHQMYDYGQTTSVYNGYGNLKRTFSPTGNPLGANRFNNRWNKGNKLNGSFNVDVRFTDFLKFDATSTIDWGHTNSHLLENMLEGPKAGVNGQVTKAQTDSYRQNHLQTLTYFDEFGKHNVNLMVGHEWFKTNSIYLAAAAQGLFTNDIPEISAAANNQYSSTSYTSGYNIEGYFVNAQYDFAQKYFATASYRRDASSRFYKDNRWGNFWSISAGWLINKEGFLKDQTWIDMLKLKASVGQQGNDNIGSYRYVDLYSLTPSSTTQMTPSFAQMGNPNLTWETTTNWNVGVDFSFWQGRLAGTLEFYNKLTTDQLFWLPVAETTGTTGYYGNMGDVRNRGLELTLSADLVRRNNIVWSVYANLSHNRNKITKLPESRYTDGIPGFSSGNLWFEEGGSVYEAFRVKFAGLDENGQALYWVDDELGGQVDRPGHNYSSTTTDFNAASYYKCGSMMPKVYGGFGTSLEVHGFDLSLSFDYQIGGKAYDSQYAGYMAVPENAVGTAFHKDVLKSWSPNNTSSDIPRWQYGDRFNAAASDRFLTNAGYLNFQNFTVGYTLPRHITQKAHISKARVYCTGENLWYWSARKGFDPRYSYTGNAYLSAYSPVRTIMGGIQVSF